MKEGSAEYARIERHLDSCKFCQHQLQTTAADIAFWQATATNLDEARDATLWDASGTPESTQASHHEAFLRQWLEPSSQPESVGRLAGYEILGVQGHGGMGLVLRGRDERLDRAVAIKIIHPHLVGHGTARARFLREARLAASVTHSHLVEIYGVDEWVGIPYFVMPLVDCSLSEYVQQQPLDIATVLRFSGQLAEALQAAHASNLIHRDLKPSNILVREDSREVVISDFGLARLVDDQGATQTVGLAGTPLFMSPEQARGETTDRRSDIFSLGSVMYWMIAGAVPFAGSHSYETLRRIVESQHKPVEAHNTDCPAWLSKLVNCMLEKDPAQRTFDARRLAEVLRQCQEHLESPSVVALPVELAATNQLAWRKRAAVAMAAGAAAILVLALATSLFRPSDGDVDGNRRDTAQADSNSPTQQELEAEPSANVLDVQEPLAFSMQDRTGPLDALDWENLKADLREQKRERYWLERLAANPKSEIPGEYLHVVDRYLRSGVTELKELAEQILLKNPFEEVATEVGADDENPFQEVESNDGF